jgi:hypothetical protein
LINIQGKKQRKKLFSEKEFLAPFFTTPSGPPDHWYGNKVLSQKWAAKI